MSHPPWLLQVLSDIIIALQQTDARLGSSFTSAPLNIDLAHAELQTIIDVCIGIQQGINPEQSSASLLQIMNGSHRRMRDAASVSILTLWRSIYTDSCIVRALAQSILSDHLAAISTLDHAIIIAGPCGEGRLDLIQDLVGKLQACILPSIPPPPRSSVALRAYTLRDQPCTIPSPQPPSLLAFQKSYSHAPFILRKYASDWPALNNWKSAAYLRSISGPGRVVPIEIGHDYRSGDWKQELMGWDSFLAALDFEDQPSSGSSSDLYYLAQHDLTKQFPSLRNDILLPDYLYASLTPADFPDYRPPNNDDQMVLNTWLGPENTMSPAHVDPYYNLYVQVVGRKTVWLAPPSVSSYMHPPTSPNKEAASGSGHYPSSALSNTSGIDVFAPDQDSGSQFVTKVVPTSMTAVLNPGDMLFFPPGWWHAMRSESTSFSLSMWF